MSMVGSNMFHIQINNRLKDIKGSSLPFGGVSIIAIGDLFQLTPVMDSYVFKETQNLEYSILAPNSWQELFTMFELDEIMRQRDCKLFAEMLNRLREGKQTTQDIIKLKERLVENTSNNYPLELPHFFATNDEVNKFNNRVHLALSGAKYSIKAHDSVIGAECQKLRDKILNQIPVDKPNKTNQLHTILKVAIGERTDISLNVRTDDGLTNGACNVIKKVQLQQPGKPSGIIWVQFDHADIGEKTRHENRHLYVQGIESTWTPIKAITSQFAVGKNRTAQIVRKQFPLRPAGAKTIHRSQGSTETQIVVNFKTNRAIPHLHYVGLSRVTNIEGLHIADLYEEKITVSADVKKEMERLRTHAKLELSICPLYNVEEILLKFCYLNARSLHRHIEDVRKDFNYSSADVLIFSETRFSQSDHNSLYALQGYTLFRNDATMLSGNVRPFGGMAVYSRMDYYCNGADADINRSLNLLPAPHRRNVL